MATRHGARDTGQGGRAARRGGGLMVCTTQACDGGQRQEAKLYAVCGPNGPDRATWPLRRASGCPGAQAALGALHFRSCAWPVGVVVVVLATRVS
jgi:hypothetical protein